MNRLIAVAIAAAAPAAASAQAQTAPAQPAAVPSAAVTPEARIKELEGALARQRQIAANARFQVERMRAEMREKDELIELARQRNRALFDKASEILDRYAQFGLGDLLSTREPFIQKGRVELENQVQAYEDALRAARFTSDTLPPRVEARMKAELGAAPGAETAEPAPAPDSDKAPQPE